MSVISFEKVIEGVFMVQLELKGLCWVRLPLHQTEPQEGLTLKSGHILKQQQLHH